MKNRGKFVLFIFLICLVFATLAFVSFASNGYVTIHKVENEVS